MIRYKTGYHSLVRALIPSLGIAQLEWAIVNISAEIEVTANPSTEVPYHSNWEVDSLMVLRPPCAGRGAEKGRAEGTAVPAERSS